MPILKDDQRNRGVLYGRKEGDFIGGTLPYEVVIADGDHLAFVPTNEPQSGIPQSTTDRYNCVTQAHHNTIENIIMRDIALHRIPQTHIDWLEANGYFDSNGKVNFSERYNTLLNGTIQNVGNYVWKVCEDGRKDSGLIPQSMLPDMPQMVNADYYNAMVITPEMKAKGQEFLQWFNLPYEWIGSDIDEIRKHMKQAPLMFTKPGHEIVGVKVVSDSKHKINDSYSPFIKDLSQSSILDVMKVLVQYKIKEGVSMAEVIDDGGTIKVQMGLPGKKIWIGINSQKVFNQIVASGEPIIQKPAEGNRTLILEDGIIADED